MQPHRQRRPARPRPPTAVAQLRGSVAGDEHVHLGARLGFQQRAGQLAGVAAGAPRALAHEHEVQPDPQRSRERVRAGGQRARRLTPHCARLCPGELRPWPEDRRGCARGGRGAGGPRSLRARAAARARRHRPPPHAAALRAQCVAGRPRRSLRLDADRRAGPWWHVRAARRAGRECDVFLSTNSYLTTVLLRVPAVTVVYDLVTFDRAMKPNRRSAAIERLTLGLAVDARERCWPSRGRPPTSSWPASLGRETVCGWSRWLPRRRHVSPFPNQREPPCRHPASSSPWARSSRARTSSAGFRVCRPARGPPARPPPGGGRRARVAGGRDPGCAALAG